MEFVGDTKDLERAFKKSAASGKQWGRSLSTLSSIGDRNVKTFKQVAFWGKRAAIGGVALLGYEAKRSLDAWQEADKVQRNTVQVLKSTHRAANVTAKGVGRLSDAVSRKTGIDDEAIQKGANLLLTFKNVRNELGKGNAIFDRGTKAAIDLSAAGFGSIDSAAKQMGKALNDPVKGIAALGRAGVTFTQEQKDQIKTLVATNRTLEAQKIILREVESQVGGQAQAQAKASDKLKVSLGNVEEAIGRGLDPAFQNMNKTVDEFVNRHMPELDKAGRDLERIFGRKDLDLGQKVKLSTAAIRRDLGPAAKEIEHLFRDAHIGQAIGDAIEDGVPIIARNAGHLGVAGAKAFAKAFVEGDAMTKLALGAFFITKFVGWKVVFAALGKAGALAWSKSFGATAAAGSAAAGRSSATAFSTSFAATARGQQGTFAALGAKYGKWLRGGIVAGVTIGLADALAPSFNKAMEDLTGQPNASDPTKGGAQKKADDRAKNLPRSKPRKKGQLPALDKRVSDPVKKKLKKIAKGSSVIAHASGEAGGSELGSLQSALAWIKKNYGSALRWTAIEDAGAANQHLHVGADPKTIVVIGKALQAMGFSVAENPAFGGVRGVHTKGSDHYSGMAIDVNADYRRIMARGSPQSTGATGATRSGAAKAVKKKADDIAKRTAAALRKVEARANAQARANAGMQREWSDYRERRKGFKDNTLSNPWLTAYFDQQDYLAATGGLSQAQADVNKTAALQNAMPHLSTADRVSALGTIRGLTPEATIPGWAKGQADLALAGLTAGGDDDLTALTGLKGIAQGQLDTAVTASDWEGVAQWAAEVKNLTDSIEELNETMKDEKKAVEDNTEAGAQYVEALKEQLKQARLAAATSGSTAAALMNYISQQQGNKLAPRALTPSYGRSRRT